MNKEHLRTLRDRCYECDTARVLYHFTPPPSVGDPLPPSQTRYPNIDYPGTNVIRIGGTASHGRWVWIYGCYDVFEQSRLIRDLSYAVYADIKPPVGAFPLHYLWLPLVLAARTDGHIPEFEAEFRDADYALVMSPDDATFGFVPDFFRASVAVANHLIEGTDNVRQFWRNKPRLSGSKPGGRPRVNEEFDDLVERAWDELECKSLAADEDIKRVAWSLGRLPKDVRNARKRIRERQKRRSETPR